MSSNPPSSPPLCLVWCSGYRRVAQGEYGTEDEMNIMLTADPQAKHLPGFSLGGLQLTAGKDEEAGKTA